MMRILSTKRLPFAQRERLLLPGIQYQEADFIQLKQIEFPFPEDPEVFIFSSQNAVKSFFKNPLSGNFTQVPCWVVGQNTADLLQKNGYNVVLQTHYAEDLVSFFPKQNHHQKVVFFAGNSRRDVIPQALDMHFEHWQECLTYEMQLSPVAFEGRFDVILFFSPSAVTSFLMANELHDARPICIGETTAAYFKENERAYNVAHQPLLPLVITEALRYIKNGQK